MTTAEQEIKTRQVPVTMVFDKNARATTPVVVNEGGADSSKSYSIAQLLVQKFKNEYNKVILITCKTLPQLKLSAYKLILELLRDYGHYGYLKHNKSERTLYYRAHNNLLIFLSVEDPERIKSMEFNYIWMEEAGELISFPRTGFIDLMQEHSSLAMNMIARLSMLLHHLTRVIQRISLEDVNTRLAGYILGMAENMPGEGDEGERTVILAEKKMLLASILGTIPETLSHSFARLSKQGIISVKGQEIRILNFHKLIDIAAGEKN